VAGRREEPGTGGEVLERPEQKTAKPRLFNVILHNDDYTTMEFVVHILETVFLKPEPDAFRIMMQVHLEGRGVCGAYPFDIAETKAETVHELARDNGYPLRASVEEANV
jgi:ATP-dependent Clp protease adaptor protein ClpS